MGGIFGGGSSGGGSIEQAYNSLQVQTSIFGKAVPLLYGTNRLPGNIIDFQGFSRTAITQGGGGGKGGGGGGSSTTYDYHVGVAIALGQGPINGIGRVWGGTSTMQLAQYISGWSIDQATSNAIQAMYWYNDTAGMNGLTWLQQNPSFKSASSGTLTAALTSAGFYTLDTETDLTAFFGTLTQSPWGWMSTYYPANALNYPLMAYVAGYIDLGDSAYVPNYSIEYFGPYIFGGGILDANPALVLEDILTNTIGGARYPAAYLGSLTNLSNYCLASGIFISPIITDQTQASEIVNNIMQCCNAQPVVSQGILNFVPYGTKTISGNGATYTPNLTPIYTITDDDILFDGSNDPVQDTRDEEITDLYNFQQVTFSNRADEYASDVATAIDQGSIDRFDALIAPTVSLESYVCDAGIAQIIAQNILQRIAYSPEKPTLKLPYFPFILLDPMDLISIVEDSLGYDDTLIRVTSMEVDDQKEISFGFEVVGLNSSDAVQYSRQASTRTTVNYNVLPGDVNPPVIFEPPDAVGGGNIVMIGASGGNVWGGSYVYISQDQNSYKSIGQISIPARQGLLTAALASGSDPDTTDTLAVDLTESAAQLSSGTQADADNLNTLCLVDGELLSYETATLTATNKYNLTYLRRGAYGTTIAAHVSGAQFLRVDTEKLLSYGFDPNNIGQTIYIKFLSYNIYGGSLQNLADVPVYQYTIKGTALLSPLPAIQNAKFVYKNGNATLVWDMPADYRSPLMVEIRKGSSPAAGNVIYRGSASEWTVTGNDTYWLSPAYSVVYNGVQTLVYSSTWTEIDVPAGARISLNVIGSYDEGGLGWLGTCSGGAFVNPPGSAVELQGTGVQEVASMQGLSSMYFAGGIQMSGAYESLNVITTPQDQLVNTSVAYKVSGVAINSDFDLVPDVDLLADWDGSSSSAVVAQLQINVYSSGAWSGWQNWTQAQYYGSKFKFRVLLTSSNSTVTPSLSVFKFEVDVDTLPQGGTFNSAADGSFSVTYPAPYNVAPKPVVTITNPQAGDVVTLLSQTATGFTGLAQNAGSGVVRNLNYQVTSY